MYLPLPYLPALRQALPVLQYVAPKEILQPWAKPLLWTLQEFLFLSGLLFMEEISNTLKSFWRRIRGK